MLSPEDRISRLLLWLADFEAVGVPAIYVIQPENGALMRFQDGGLLVADQVLLRDRAIAWQEIAVTPR